MSAPDPNVLRTSRDPRELKNAAMGLASSASAADHEVLGRYLSTGEFLARLDDEKAYGGTTARLRLTPVMDALMTNRLASTDKVLLGLIDAPDFQGDVLRMILLVRALGVVRPSPPEAVRYWDGKSAPESPLAQDVVEALCVNQSDPALELLEKKFADPGHDVALKVFWMRLLIMPRRNDVPLLTCCERMLAGSLPEGLRPALVEALFDYRPQSWYRDCDPPRPPPRALASKEAKEIFLRVGESALLGLPLEEGQKAAVRAGLIEFGHKGRR